MRCRRLFLARPDIGFDDSVCIGDGCLPGVPGSVTRDAPLQRRYRIAGALVQAGERIAENGIVIASSPRFLRPSYYGKAARRCTASCHCLAAMAK
ncbi:hypothetical protein CBM2592_U10004 [Cupriavidus taiwanensis]|nr:hypothetical protein CBM2592_U10004 [Cupriavidus taiwanensis]SOZ00965.1 hypothetical protein CBM2591_U10005 [Cupriavidus taiwanensis]